jgi:hypothetical protein
MILNLSLSGYEIHGNTFKCKDLFKAHKLRWNPTKRCWEGEDFSAISKVRFGLKQYREKLHVVTSEYKVNPICKEIQIEDTKKYRTGKYSNKCKVSTLKGLSNLGLDGNVCELIFKTAFPKGYGTSCRCADKYTCSLCYYACCEKARGVFCVCKQATQCPTHGRRCNGSHD